LPELSRFFGIIIRMFVEAGEPHHAAHFHAYYQNAMAVFTIEPVELVAGELPVRQRRLVEAWAALHQADLWEAWHRLQSGRLPAKIVPVK